ncbi:MAG: molybdopterin dehydrogenase FAD-binding protein [Phycisphaerales bacterium]|nr:molybdopterin dehydrogenase FAD-binding protein [Phycisphaerales bacterium]
MRDHVLLYLNGRVLRISGDDAFLTLAEYLRRRQNLTGTKIVCAEGDCGSCAVLIGRPAQGAMRYAAVTSCIQLLFQLDASHVVTVEGLRDGQQLNPIQQAMVACHGAQCGFCTPGFVVSLYDLMHDGRTVDAQSICRGLVGNLCRCTGYDSIVRSALTADRQNLKPLDALYPPGPLIEALEQSQSQEVLIETPSCRYFKPTTLDRAVHFRADNPNCTIIAGGTDLAVVHNKRIREITAALSTTALAELNICRRDPDALYIGAGATLTALEQAALTHLPELGRFLAWFGSPLIKNAGTLAGNLVTGSPIGDTLPALIVLGAEIDVAGLTGTRRIPIANFYSGYRKTVLAPDELLTGVRIPLPLTTSHEIFKLYKVSRRKDLDISSFSAAIWLRRQSPDGPIDDIRIALGGVGPMVLRPTRAEESLRGQQPTLDLFERAANLAAADVTPITDVRGSEAYRRALASNILLKFWHETFGTPQPDRNENSNGDGPNGHPTAPNHAGAERRELRDQSAAPDPALAPPTGVPQ